jgi:excisionase family DNA binding protein
MEQQRNARKGSRLQRQIEELQKRMEAVEDILDNAKDVLTVEEASRFMDIARSSLYKMTSDRSIPFYRPNGKMIYFEKADILAWIRQNRVMATKKGDGTDQEPERDDDFQEGKCQ